MSKLYKLTTQDNKTRKGCYNECVWGEGVSHSGTGEGDLCGPGFIHAYDNPYLAVLLNPIHAEVSYPKIWEAEGDVVKNDRGLKVGCITLTTIKIIPLPIISNTQKVAFGILCAKEVYKESIWTTWADNWLNNVDRSARSAHSAAHSAYSAYSARSAAYSAAHSAYSDANSAYSDANSALDFEKIISLMQSF